MIQDSVNKQLRDLVPPFWRYVDRGPWYTLLTSIMDPVWDPTKASLEPVQDATGQAIWRDRP